MERRAKPDRSGFLKVDAREHFQRTLDHQIICAVENKTVAERCLKLNLRALKPDSISEDEHISLSIDNFVEAVTVKTTIWKK